MKTTGNWRPIELAPHDGRFLLVARFGWHWPSIARWWNDCWEDDHGHSTEPTHWMLLPAMPEDSNA